MDRSQIKKELDDILQLSSSKKGDDDNKLQTYNDAVEVFMNPHAPSFYVILAEQELRQRLLLNDAGINKTKEAPPAKLTSADLTQTWLDESKKDQKIDECLPVYEMHENVKSTYDEYLPHKLDYSTVKKDQEVRILLILILVIYLMFSRLHENG